MMSMDISRDRREFLPLLTRSLPFVDDTKGNSSKELSTTKGFRISVCEHHRAFKKKKRSEDGWKTE